MSYESNLKRDDLAVVGQTVTLQAPKEQKPAEPLDPARYLEGWTITTVKVDEKGRPVQVFLYREGALHSLCLSGWVTNDGTPLVHVRGAS